MTDEGLVWHYTTADGLLNIVRHHRMWAGSAAFMNDSSDVLTGRLAMHQEVEARRASLKSWQLDQLSALGVMKSVLPEDYFLLCGSTDGDALSLWRSYGGGSVAEYALGFDPNVTMEPVLQNPAKKHPEPAPAGWYDEMYDYDEEGNSFFVYDPDDANVILENWQAVKYLSRGNSHVADELERLLKMMKKPSGPGRRVLFNFQYTIGIDPTVFFKHSGFEDERESRAAWRVQPRWRFVKYRPTRFGATPYIEVAARRADMERPTSMFDRYVEPLDIGPLPLRALRIGPTRVGDEAQRAVESALAASGYGDVRVTRSETPFR